MRQKEFFHGLEEKGWTYYKHEDWTRFIYTKILKGSENPGDKDYASISVYPIPLKECSRVIMSGNFYGEKFNSICIEELSLKQIIDGTQYFLSMYEKITKNIIDTHGNNKMTHKVFINKKGYPSGDISPFVIKRHNEI